MTKKETFKKLRELSRALPPDFYTVVHGSGKSMREQEHPVSHFRRMKSLWNRYKDIDIINEYCWKYSMELKYSNDGSIKRNSKEIPNR